jgi:NAD+ kinase
MDLNVLIVFNAERQGEEIALQCAEILRLNGTNVEISEFNNIDVSLFKNVDIAIAVGGDGTILKVAKISATVNVPIVGINSGRIGYLASLNADNLDLLENLSTGDYSTENRYMLKAEISNGEKQIAECDCLNDAVISKSANTTMIDISVTIENDAINYRSDGFIVATPTGSTAYSMSAGGPIVDPTLNSMILTPVCPHTLMTRSMVIDGNNEISITVGGDDKTEIFFFADGRGAVPLKNGSVIKITRSNLTASFIKFNDLSVYKVFSEKSRL